MTYTSMVVANSILLSPLLLVITLIAWGLARWLRLFPEGVPGFLSFVVIGLTGLGAFTLYNAASLLVMMPADLQRDYLGARYASAFDLRDVDMQFSFQDPSAEWRYAVTPAVAETLRRRCDRSAPPPRPGECLVYQRMDERVMESATISDDNLLRISWGLW
jgi:hypothetical protein